MGEHNPAERLEPIRMDKGVSSKPMPVDPAQPETQMPFDRLQDPSATTAHNRLIRNWLIAPVGRDFSHWGQFPV